MTENISNHKNHYGEWVAVCEGKVVVCADNPSDVIDKAREVCGNKEREIFRVPEKDQILLL